MSSLRRTSVGLNRVGSFKAVKRILVTLIEVERETEIVDRQRIRLIQFNRTLKLEDGGFRLFECNEKLAERGVRARKLWVDCFALR